MTMIALLNNTDDYFIDDQKSVKDFLIAYANYIGLDTKIFNILANSGEMSDKELIEYINRFSYTHESINEIYEIGKKLY